MRAETIAMSETRLSLLVRVRDRADGASWREFYAISPPLIFGDLCDPGLKPLDADELTQVDLPEVVVETWPLPPSLPGLEALVLLAREDSPLPREADAALEQDLAGSLITQLPDGMTEAVWIENGQVFGLDDQGKERTAPGPKTRKTDDPVLRVRELLGKKLPGRGDYHRAVIVPNKGGPSAPGSVSP
jgi:hypothetical protein